MLCFVYAFPYCFSNTYIESVRMFFFQLKAFFSDEEKEGRIDSKRGRIATNALSVPKDQVKG